MGAILFVLILFAFYLMFSVKRLEQSIVDSDNPFSIDDLLKNENVKSTIDIKEITSGGVAKDGILSIDNPKFIECNDNIDIDMAPDSFGVVVEINNKARFYPFNILVWHEIVNDNFEGIPLAVTYCPLCRTAIVFDRRVDDKTFIFGVSGKLWQSNLLMYNKEKDLSKESLWSQVKGESVVGEYAGKQLKVLQSNIMKFSDFKTMFTQRQVLSKDTGINKDYGVDPYTDYYKDNSLGSDVTFTDKRLEAKSFVFGVNINSQYKAYYLEKLENNQSFEDDFAGEKIKISKDDHGIVEFRNLKDDSKITFIFGYWFSWIGIHSDSELKIYEK